MAQKPGERLYEQTKEATQYKLTLAKLRKHFQDLFKKKDDGKIKAELNGIVSSTLAKGIHILEDEKNEELDRETVDIIQLAILKTPKDLEARISNNEDVVGLVSAAIHELGCMTSEKDHHGKLVRINQCVTYCKEVAKMTLEKEPELDDILPVIMYVLSKHVPQDLQSTLFNLYNFIEDNRVAVGCSGCFTDDIKFEQYHDKQLDNSLTHMIVAVEQLKKILKPSTKDEADYYVKKMYEDDRVNRLEKELNIDFFNLGKKIKEAIQIGKDITTEHREDFLKIADELDKYKKNVQIAKSVGLGTSVMGSILGVVGFGLMFTTFGGSLILVVVGAGVSSLGTATSIGATIKQYGNRKSAAHDIQRKRQQYEDIVQDVLKTLEKITKTTDSLTNKFTFGGSNAALLASMSNTVLQMLPMTTMIDNTAEIGSTIFNAATAAGRGVAIAGVAINSVLVFVDLALLGYNLNKLRTDEKASMSIMIRKWLEKEWLTDKVVDSMLDDITRCTLEHVKNIREKRSNMAESNNKLEETLRKVGEELAQ